MVQSLHLNSLLNLFIMAKIIYDTDLQGQMDSGHFNWVHCQRESGEAVGNSESRAVQQSRNTFAHTCFFLREALGTGELWFNVLSPQLSVFSSEMLLLPALQ